MNRGTRRFLHASLGFCALTSFVGASYPRLVAWSDTSTSHTIASQRAASCLVVVNPIVANTLITDGSGRPVGNGKFICDWQGNSAQITNGGYAGYVRSGQPEQISEILKGRGFKQPQ